MSNKEQISISTNKASGLTARMNITTAERHAAKSDESGLWYYYELTREMLRLGASVDPFVKAYRSHPNRKTHVGAGLGNYLGAVKRAVAKYGSVEKADAAFTAWCRDKKGGNRERKGGIADFIQFAPAGQRAKNTATKTVHTAVTITRTEGVKRLRANGYTTAEANRIATALGLV